MLAYNLQGTFSIVLVVSLRLLPVARNLFKKHEKILVVISSHSAKKSKMTLHTVLHIDERFPGF